MPRGQPRKFSSGKVLVDLFRAFCEYIIAAEYSVIPSQTEFCKYLSGVYAETDRRTIYNALNKYFPDIKKEIEKLQSDLIAQGAMLGYYKGTMSIFVLKNWCNWGDNVHVDGDTTNNGVVILAKIKED